MVTAGTVASQVAQDCPFAAIENKRRQEIISNSKAFFNNILHERKRELWIGLPLCLILGSFIAAL